MRQMNWDDIRLFKALVNAGTVRGAGKALGVSHSTVARRIDQLEMALGVPLLSRSRGEYVLTQAGRELLEVAEEMDGSVTGLARRALGQARVPEGEVRLTMIDAMVHSPLMDALQEFSDLFPKIHLEIDLRNCPADLDKQEADVALRFTADPPGHLIGRKVAECGVATYACSQYAGKLRNTGQGLVAKWIGFQPRSSKKKWLRHTPFPDAPVVGTLASQAGQYAACKSGMGLAQLPCFMGEADDALTRLSPTRHPPQYQLWILRHPDLRHNGRARRDPAGSGVAARGRP